MRAAFACEPNPTGERLRTETEAAFRRVDTRRLLERVTIESAGTRVAHGFGGIPRWSLFSKEGPGDVYETQRADREFLYLISDPADVVVSLELF